MRFSTAPLSRWAAGLLLVGMAGCTLTYRQPAIGELYSRAAQYHGPERRAIIVIPGVLGSKLLEQGSDRIVWGAFAGGYAKPGRPDGARLIAHPMAEGRSLAELTDRVYAGDVLDTIRVRLLALPLSLKAYFHLIEVLGAGGYRDEGLALAGEVDYGDDHFTCFQFPYDFRRDNVENAGRLHRFILEKRAYIQAELERRFGVVDVPVKFDLVAHSMGALVARYYLRYGDADLGSEGELPELTWAGSRYLERVVLVAPPNAGSLEALHFLIQGRKFALFLPRYPAALLGTFPSLYQLLPRSRHRALVWADGGAPVEDLLDPELWRELGWGLAAPAADETLRVLLPDVGDPDARRRIALDHQSKSLSRARRLAAALDRPASPPAEVRLSLIAGDSVDTAARAEVDRATGRLRVIEWGPGDGSVLRTSATMDERVGGAWKPTLETPIDWHSSMFLFTDHLGLTRDPMFTDNVLHWLLEQPREPPSPAADPPP